MESENHGRQITKSESEEESSAGCETAGAAKEEAAGHTRQTKERVEFRVEIFGVKRGVTAPRMIQCSPT